MIRKHRSKRSIALLAILLGAILSAHATEYRSLQWWELQPEADRIAMQHLPPIDHRSVPNSVSDPLAGLTGLDESGMTQNLARQQATAVLHSTTIRPELDGMKVQLEGFIVPIEMNGNGAVTEFFLVPYIGACIHVPPPPPNQMVYVQYPSGIDAGLINEPVRVEGTLHTENTRKSLTAAAYSIHAEHVLELKIER